jgi:hypothetical protein
MEDARIAATKAHCALIEAMRAVDACTGVGQ